MRGYRKMEEMSVVATTNFETNYEPHQKHLKRKGLQPKTIDAYSRAVRRVGDYFAHQIDDLSEADLLDYFAELRETHSGSSLKLDLYGLKAISVKEHTILLVFSPVFCVTTTVS
jgi:integrase/recombinase XerD